MRQHPASKEANRRSRTASPRSQAMHRARSSMRFSRDSIPRRGLDAPRCLPRDTIWRKGACMAKTRSRTKRTASAARSRSAKPPAKQRAAARQSERRKQNPETLRLRAFQPSLTVNELDRSIRFYTDVLGFIVGQRWNDDKGVLRGVMLKAGACELGLSQDDWAKGRDRQ